MSFGVKVTHEEFVEKMAVCHPNIEVLSIYERAIVPVKCKCKSCGLEWKARPANLTVKGRSTGCPRCSGKYKRTQAEFISDMQTINPNVEILSEYVDSHADIRARCKLHNYEYITTPTTLLAGQGCKYCRSEKVGVKKAQQGYLRIKSLVESSGYDFLVEFDDYHKDRQMSFSYRCAIHGVVDNDKIWAFERRGCRCKICHDEEALVDKPTYFKKSNIRKTDIPGYIHPLRCTHERFMEKLKKVNTDVEVLSKYEKSNEKISVRCLICGHEYMVTPGKLLLGRKCPACAASNHESRIANALKKYAKENYSDVICEYKVLRNPATGYYLPFDIYIGQYNIYCEVNGSQHYVYDAHSHYFKSYADYTNRLKIDAIKRNFAKTNGNYLEIDLRKTKDFIDARDALRKLIKSICSNKQNIKS